MTEQIDDERFAEVVAQPFMGEQTLHVEEIARVLPVQCCNQLARKQVFEENNAGFRKAERLFDHLGDRNGGRFMNHATQYGRDFDLDLRALRNHEKTKDGAVVDVFGDASAGQLRQSCRLDALHGAASIPANASGLSCTGRYIRSISTERRGRLRTKRLIAVPPLSAKKRRWNGENLRPLRLRFW